MPTIPVGMYALVPGGESLRPQEASSLCQGRLLPRSDRGWRLRPPLAFSDGAGQNFGRDMESLVQSADHGERQGAIPAQHFVDPGAAADDADERLLVPALLFEAELDGLDGIRRIDGKWGAGADIGSMMSARFAAANLDGASAIASNSFAWRNRRPHKAGVCASPPSNGEKRNQEGAKKSIFGAGSCFPTTGAYIATKGVAT